MRDTLGDQRGAGLLEVLIVSGLLLMIIEYMTQSLAQGQGMQKRYKLKTSTLFLESFVNNSVNCAATKSLIGGKCLNNKFVEILSGSHDNNSVLIKIGSTKKDENGNKILDYTKVGKYLVRAKCNRKDNKIMVQANLVNKNNKPIKQPYSKKIGWFDLSKSYKNNDFEFKCVL